MGGKRVKVVEVLLVERDQQYAQEMRKLLREEKIVNSLHIVCNQYEALDYIRQVGKYWDRSEPDVVITDCALPNHGCEELLSEIRSEPAFFYLPIIFISTPGEMIPFETADYMVRFVEKPLSGKILLEALTSFENFWIAVTLIKGY
ncbi:MULTISPECIES: response regulator [Aminobacterium]|jgi:CheY-like chemotaxis protein|uniref:response regulator n=1 Tax=Aminobacterium TaxID=81466 RepID=UPI00046799E5|nr:MULTISPECIES: response regulator [Aminobacterium]